MAETCSVVQLLITKVLGNYGYFCVSVMIGWGCSTCVICVMDLQLDLLPRWVYIQSNPRKPPFLVMYMM